MGLTETPAQAGRGVRSRTHVAAEHGAIARRFGGYRFQPVVRRGAAGDHGVRLRATPPFAGVCAGERASEARGFPVASGGWFG